MKKQVGNSLVGLTLEEITLSFEVNMNKEPENWYKSYSVLFDDTYESFKDCITLKTEHKKLFEYNLTLKYICDKIKNIYDDLYCVFSPYNEGQIDIFVNSNSVELEENVLYVNQENKVMIYLQEVVIPLLKQEYICGIEGVDEVFLQKEDGEWIAETNSINMKKTNQFITYRELLCALNGIIQKPYLIMFGIFMKFLIMKQQDNF